MNERRPARVLGYARVSSVEQALGTSLQDQQAAMASYAAGRGLKVARFFVESESGIHEKIERRQEMKALLAAVRAGDLVLCHRVDRWSRDPEFTYKSMRELVAKDVSVFFVDDRVDPATSEGDTALGFRILFAREEHKRIKQRLVGTRKLLRGAGLYVEGLPPLGYRRQDTRTERNVLVVVEDEAATVRDIFRRCIQGEAINEIAAALGIKRDKVNDVLHRKLYLGELDGVRGKHPAIIDARTYQAAQEALRSRAKGSRSTRDAEAETADWWLRDVARCGLCGGKAAAAYGPRRVGFERLYYFRCFARCKGARYVLVREAENDFTHQVEKRLVALKEELAGPPPAPAKAPDLRERRAKLEAKRARYAEAYADGGLTREQLRLALARLDVERLKIDALEAAPPVQSAAERRAELRSVGRLFRAWWRMAPRERRILVNRLAVSVAIDMTGEYTSTPTWRDAGEVDLASVADALLVVPMPNPAEERAAGERILKMLGRK